MLSIDKENRKIILKNGTVTLVFDLIIGYVCPKCSRLLRAYWVDDYEEYDPLDFIDPQKDHGERYIFFRGLGGSGLELREHDCKGVFEEFNMQKNVTNFITGLNWNLINKGEEIFNHLLKFSVEELMIKLREYNAQFIFDICEVENPLLILEDEKVIGHKQNKDYSVYFEIKDQRIKKFLEKFGLDNEYD